MKAAAGSDGAADGARGKVETAPFPWDAVMHAGLFLLRLPPRDFWAMTPREFFIITGGTRRRATPLARGVLDALMGEFPDR
ncbi:rcc01693 family protein [Neorhizobium alkalisoli]|uniref:rcc01693 family protein n=1 Tax=Neorhizobium alkalisoli TaxID=528178 RepID=UPI0024848185|nr:rcc01693 family protein [Neorhizobium alkalisoli]